MRTHGDEVMGDCSRRCAAQDSTTNRQAEIARRGVALAVRRRADASSAPALAEAPKDRGIDIAAHERFCDVAAQALQAIGAPEALIHPGSCYARCDNNGIIRCSIKQATTTKRSITAFGWKHGWRRVALEALLRPAGG
jgi:hypothetical protein